MGTLRPNEPWERWQVVSALATQDGISRISGISPLFFFFFKKIEDNFGYFSVCLCMHTWVSFTTCMYHGGACVEVRGQFLGSRFSSSTLWVPGIELASSDLAVSTSFAGRAISSTPPSSPVKFLMSLRSYEDTTRLLLTTKSFLKCGKITEHFPNMYRNSFDEQRDNWQEA